jgi:hypothetical protein
MQIFQTQKVICTRLYKTILPQDLIFLIAAYCKVQVRDVITSIKLCIGSDRNGYVRDQVMLGLDMNGTLEALAEDDTEGIYFLQEWLDGRAEEPGTENGVESDSDDDLPDLDVVD